MTRLKNIFTVIGIDLGILIDPYLELKQAKYKRRNSIILWILFLVYFPLSNHFLGTICPIQNTTGFPCPTCGSTRAAGLLLRGDFSEAFKLHPLILISLATLLYIAIRHVVISVKNLERKQQGDFSPQYGNVQTKALRTNIVIFVILLYFGVYFYRLFTMFPNEEPMIYNYDSIFARIYLLFAS